jgi:hypothetical protein
MGSTATDVAVDATPTTPTTRPDGVFINGLIAVATARFQPNGKTAVLQPIVNFDNSFPKPCNRYTRHNRYPFVVEWASAHRIVSTLAAVLTSAIGITGTIAIQVTIVIIGSFRFKLQDELSGITGTNRIVGRNQTRQENPRFLQSQTDQVIPDIRPVMIVRHNRNPSLWWQAFDRPPAEHYNLTMPRSKVKQSFHFVESISAGRRPAGDLSAGRRPPTSRPPTSRPPTSR